VTPRGAPQPPATRDHLVDALIALTLAELPFAVQLRHRVPYFTDWSPLPYVAAVLDVLLVASAIYALLRWDRRLTRPGWRAVVEWALLVLAVISMNQLRRHLLPFSAAYLWGWVVPSSANAFPIVRDVTVVACLALLWRARERRTQLVRFGFGALLIVSPFALWGLGRALVEIAGGGSPATFAGRNFAPARAGAVTDAASPRVVIALFDMCDFGVAFARRPESLDLPGFDALRGAALFTTNAVSPGNQTMRSLPSLLTGTAVDSVVAVAPAQLKLLGNARKPDIWGEGATLLSEAKRRGMRSSVIGWYLPYCATFGSLLDSCWSAPNAAIRSFPAQLVDQARSAMGMSLARSAVDDWADAHTRLLEAQRAEAFRIITSGRSRLVFLHIAVPHWPWIYDRRARAERVVDPSRADGYLDNLALADSVLREILYEVNNDPHTTLVVTADHPYAPPLWAPALPRWFVNDPRVPFIVRLPGQREPIEYDRPTNTVLLSTMTMRILEGRIQTADQLRQWLDAASEAIADSATAFQR
jgi:hypothetical protein